ncbi:hypothetical protein [Rugamonas apoptosis]|uniref:Immunity protein 52 domain-containing protein n=1 Tax=Rugamonas apoptosis TaxID=2758570 RepID=A0A7W2IKC9_9BURK|nr:hypothetical protein [Rugamonas apoptosis]MBA5687241.1 hypothetical protein [Rugamonas apoptosis]
MTGRQYTDWLSHLLKELQRSAPCFARYAVLRSNGYQAMLPDFSNFDACVAHNQPHDWAFETEGSDRKDFTMAAWPKMSFSNSFVTSSDTEGSGCFVSVCAGSRRNFSPDNVVLQMSADLATSEIAEQVFRTLISCTAPVYGVAVRRKVRMLTGQPLKEKPVGWLTYWSDEQALEKLPAHIQAEHLGSGVLIRTEAMPPLTADTEALVRLQELIDELRGAGCLGKPLINPLPGKRTPA